MRATTKAILAAAAALLIQTAAAQADEWRIVKTTGEVWVGAVGLTPVSLGGTMTTIPDGGTLITGNAGRVQLARGAETMVVGPNSAVTVPPTDPQGFTTILQRAGEISFDVDVQNVKHFDVETPFLAAVVKGTAFTIQVGAGTTNLAVTRGLVEATDLATGEVANVAVGQTAAAAGPGVTMTTTPGVIVIPGTPRAPMSVPLTVAEGLSFQNGTSALASNSGSGSTDRVPGFVVAAGGGAGGNGGGPTGTTFSGNTGGPGASPAPTVLAFADSPGVRQAASTGLASAQSAFASASGGSSKSAPADQGGSQQLILALLIVVTSLLGLGLAFLRGRMR